MPTTSPTIIPIQPRGDSLKALTKGERKKLSTIVLEFKQNAGQTDEQIARIKEGVPREVLADYDATVRPAIQAAEVTGDVYCQKLRALLTTPPTTAKGLAELMIFVSSRLDLLDLLRGNGGDGDAEISRFLRVLTQSARIIGESKDGTN
jgi:hypothetical protein